jgi:hypothetical protein
VSDIAKLRRDDCADASERAEVDTVFAEAYQLVRSESSGDATQVFMMRILDQAHNLEGFPDASKAVRLHACEAARARRSATSRESASMIHMPL